VYEAGGRGGGAGVSFDAYFRGIERFCWRFQGSAERGVCKDGCPAEGSRAGSGETSREQPSFPLSLTISTKCGEMPSTVDRVPSGCKCRKLFEDLPELT